MILPSNFIRKVKVLEICQSHIGIPKFSKILIFTWKSKLNHWQKILSIIFLEVTHSFHLFKKWFPNTQVMIIVRLSVILSCKNDVALKSGQFGSWLRVSYECRSLIQTSHFGVEQSCCTHTSHFAHRQLNRCVFKVQIWGAWVA